MTTMPAPSRRRTGNLIATLLLIGLSVGTAVVLYFNALLWAMGSVDNSVPIAIGGYLPLVFTVLGAVAGIVALARRRTAFWYPVVALVLSVVVWLIALAIVR